MEKYSADDAGAARVSDAVFNSDTGDASPGVIGESERVSNSDTWRRCLVDEPEEGQLVLVVEPDIPSMPDVCVYRGGQFVDGIGRGDAMEVKSFWLWLPLPPLPETL